MLHLEAFSYVGITGVSQAGEEYQARFLANDQTRPLILDHTYYETASRFTGARGKLSDSIYASAKLASTTSAGRGGGCTARAARLGLLDDLLIARAINT